MKDARDIPAAPDLTGILAELEELTDRATAIAVAETLGGQRQYIPRPEAAAGCALAQRIGDRAATALASLRGGENIDFPKCRRAIVHQLAIVEGLSANEVAKRAGMDRRRVLTVVNDMKAAAMQPTLFS